MGHVRDGARQHTGKDNPIESRARGSEDTDEEWRAQLRKEIIIVVKRQSSKMGEDFTDLDNTRVTFF